MSIEKTPKLKTRPTVKGDLQKIKVLFRDEQLFHKRKTVMVLENVYQYLEKDL